MNFIYLLCGLLERKVTKMTSFWVYVIVEIPLPLFLALLASAGVGLTGCCVLKPSKLVRIMFPFVKRKGHDTVVFGFALSRPGIYLLYFLMLQVVFLTTFIFLSAFVEVSYTYNPYSDLDCYFFSNFSKVELSPEEALTLEEHIQCFSWKFNIGGAMGQATGTLAFTWLISAILIWVLVHLSHSTFVHIKSKKLLHCCGYCFLGAVIRIAIIAFAVTLILITVFISSRHWLSILNAIEIGVFCILLILFGLFLFHTTKKTVTLESYYRDKVLPDIEEKEAETDGVAQEQSLRKKWSIDKGQPPLRLDLLEEMAELECKKALASKTASNIDEEEMKSVVMTAYVKVMQGPNSDEGMPTEQNGDTTEALNL